jgi:hypothetical protein
MRAAAAAAERYFQNLLPAHPLPAMVPALLVPAAAPSSCCRASASRPLPSSALGCSNSRAAARAAEQQWAAEQDRVPLCTKYNICCAMFRHEGLVFASSCRGHHGFCERTLFATHMSLSSLRHNNQMVPCLLTCSAPRPRSDCRRPAFCCCCC